MPRTVINVLTPARNAAAVDADTVIDQANGMYIPATAPTRDILVRVVNSFAGAKTVTFRAGVNPPATSAGQGDLTVSLAQAATPVHFHIESARFAQANGTINVDFEAGATGKITVIRHPRN